MEQQQKRIIFAMALVALSLVGSALSMPVNIGPVSEDDIITLGKLVDSKNGKIVEADCSSLGGPVGKLCSKLAEYHSADPSEKCVSKNMADIYVLRRALNSALGFDWVSTPAKASLPLAKHFLELSNALGRGCSQNLVSMVDSAVQESPVSKNFYEKAKSMTNSMSGDCKGVAENPLVKRPDVRSLECLVEQARRKTFDITATSNLVKIRKFMGELGLLNGIGVFKSGIADSFADMVKACGSLKTGRIVQYINGLVLNDDFFNQAGAEDMITNIKSFYICDMINGSNEEIGEKITSRSIGLASKLA